MGPSLPHGKNNGGPSEFLSPNRFLASHLFSFKLLPPRSNNNNHVSSDTRQLNYTFTLYKELIMKLTINITKPKLASVKSIYNKAMTTSPQDLVDQAKKAPSTTKAFYKHCRNFTNS